MSATKRDAPIDPSSVVEVLPDDPQEGTSRTPIKVRRIDTFFKPVKTPNKEAELVPGSSDLSRTPKTQLKSETKPKSESTPKSQTTPKPENEPKSETKPTPVKTSNEVAEPVPGPSRLSLTPESQPISETKPKSETKNAAPADLQAYDLSKIPFIPLDIYKQKTFNRSITCDGCDKRFRCQWSRTEEGKRMICPEVAFFKHCYECKQNRDLKNMIECPKCWSVFLNKNIYQQFHETGGLTGSCHVIAERNFIEFGCKKTALQTDSHLYFDAPVDAGIIPPKSKE